MACIEFCKYWRVGRGEGWRVGRGEGWEGGGLEGWRVGRGEGWSSAPTPPCCISVL